MSAASQRSLGPHAFLIGAYAQSLWLRVAASAFTSLSGSVSDLPP